MNAHVLQRHEFKKISSKLVMWL